MGNKHGIYALQNAENACGLLSTNPFTKGRVMRIEKFVNDEKESCDNCGVLVRTIYRLSMYDSRKYLDICIYCAHRLKSTMESWSAKGYDNTAAK